MSRFVETQNNLFAKVGISLRQARLLEILFIEARPVTYRELAAEMGTNMQSVGRLVSTLRKKGLVLRYIGQGSSEDPVPPAEWEVDTTGKADELRDGFPIWSDWIVDEQYRLHQAKSDTAQVTA